MENTVNLVWKSKNRLWEITIEHEGLVISNTKTGIRYAVEIDRNQKAHYWFTSVNTQHVPAYVISRTERVYRELSQAGQLI